jgi:hypothetical protein
MKLGFSPGKNTVFLRPIGADESIAYSTTYETARSMSLEKITQ